ncbi:MAG: glycosyltransferase family 4 protein [Geminicoccaceae bacterium]|nr:glycosyltransferase family 4 protein [Geminicoccaceae bacterium]
MSRAGPPPEPWRTLVVSGLYPSRARPTFGVFVENRLRHLAASGAVVPWVLAPLPWCPPGGAGRPAWRPLALTPAFERRHGIPVDYPRYLHLPRLGVPIQPWTIYRALAPRLARALRDGARIDLIDAHYVYPDGVAAALLARRFDLPLVLTARGSDLNQIARELVPRRWIRWAIGRAQGLVAVCAALARVFEELGADPGRVRVLRNGVDLELFRPLDRTRLRAAFGLAGPVLLTVAQLVERKGVHLVIDALAELPGHTLLIAGDGPERAALGERARRLGLEGRVRFLGEIPHERLADLYNAADCLVLASSREGWANVLLEAMACGTPVVATAVWGTPEVVAAPEAGRLVAERSAPALAAAIRDLLAAPPPRAATRAYAERFGWEPTTAGQIELFGAVLAEWADKRRARP